jgi:hypothetical protein
MAKKEEEQEMFMMPIPMSMGGNDPLETYMKYQKFFEEMKKDESEKKKKSSKPEPKKYSFLETLTIATYLGPAIGIGYLYGVGWALKYVETLFK